MRGARTAPSRAGPTCPAGAPGRAADYLPVPGPVPRVPGFIGLGKIGCGLGADGGEDGFGAAMTFSILSRCCEFDQPDRDLGDQGDDGDSKGPSERT
jgi:hypothetical protein